MGPIRSGVGFHILKVNDLRGQSQNISVTEVHARHILLKPSPIMTDDQARAKLQQIAADIKSGKTSFANAAKEFSQDPALLTGRRPGWAAADIYDPAFRDALMKLNKGQMSAPVHSSFGWHLIELLDTRNVDKTDAAQKDRAYRMLFNRKFSEEAATDAGTTRQRLRESSEQLMKQHRVVITPANPPGLGLTSWSSLPNVAGRWNWSSVLMQHCYKTGLHCSVCL